MHDFANTSLPVSGEPSFVVTDVPKGIVNTGIRLRVDYAALVIGPAVGLFGIGSNIVNIIIFYRQGLDNTINISFFNLAISDVGSLITMTVTVCAICVSPPVVNADISIDLPVSHYLIGGWQHIWFGNITSWITVYITAERCLCVALPLKVKEIITPKATLYTISVIYLINIMDSVPDFIYIYLDWTFIPKRNKTIISLLFKEKFKFLSGVSPVLMSVVAFLPFPITIVFTVVLIVKLQQQALWRQKGTHDSQKTQLTSKREIKTMNTVVLIAVIFIVCYIPGVVVTISAYVVPDLDVAGRYANLWCILYYLVFLMHGINSSVNIFLYYKMSSKFKGDFHQLFKHYICVPRRTDDAD